MTVTTTRLRIAWVLPLLLLLLEAPLAGEPPKAAEKAPPKKPRAFLLVTIDTWRWDFLGEAGKQPVKTPNLDRLAREGLYYPRAHSAAPLTAPSHATILTGLYPFHHGVRDNDHFRLAPKVRTLATAFREKGFDTGAFVSAAPLRRSIGLDRGFGIYDDGGQIRTDALTVDEPERRADKTLEKAIAWIYGTDSRHDLFLWVHLYDPHAPYRSPKSASVKPPFDGYAGEVEFVDQQVGKLLEAITRGRDVVAAITSDHGEGLGEHGERSHGLALYDTTLTVPLILWPRPAGSAPWTSTRVALTDVAPTLCEWAGLGCGSSDGRSLLRPEPGKGSAPWLYSESLAPTLTMGIAPAYALRRGPAIAVLHKAFEVYETEKDPDQLRNTVPGAGDSFLNLARAELARIQKANPIEAMLSQAQPATPEEQRKLQSLGYIGGGIVKPRLWLSEDRRVFLARMETLDAARADAAAGRLVPARRTYETFLGLYPNASRARQEYAMTLVRQGDTANAARQFSLALEQNPADSVSALSLGNLATMKGDLVSAERFFRRSLDLEPDQTEALVNLISVLSALHRNAEARPFAERFLALAPNDPEAPKIRALVGLSR